MHIAELGVGEAASLRGRAVARQTTNPVALEAAMQGAAGQRGDGFAQAAKQVVQR